MKKSRKMKKKRQFYEAVSLMRKGSKSFLLMVLFDVLFVLSFYALGQILGFVIPNITDISKYSARWSILLVSLINVLLIILLYSFFKMAIVHFVKSMSREKELAFKGLLKFFLLNVTNIIGLYVILTLINLVFRILLRPEAVKYFMLPIFIIAGFLFYPYLNFQHFLFDDKKSIRQMLKESARFMVKNPRTYLSIYVTSIILLIIFTVAYYIIAQILISVGSAERFLEPSVMRTYESIFTAVTTLMVYLVIALNRVQFNLALEKRLK